MSGYQILCGDALTLLRTLPEASVQCVVTSPPYWGLRNYQTSRWEGGDTKCEHMQIRGMQGASGQRANRRHTQRMLFKGVCGNCGAIREDEQIGLEETPTDYVAKIVSVFREVRRVLKGDGTAWVNLGDCYHQPDKGGYRKQVANINDKQQSNLGSNRQGLPNRQPHPTLKAKDLCMMPARVALALQADGWYLRQEIIWHKPNPMPESVRDRCTKAHEYIYLLAKSERYHFDADAIKEPTSKDSHARYARGRSEAHKYAEGGPGN